MTKADRLVESPPESLARIVGQVAAEAKRTQGPALRFEFADDHLDGEQDGSAVEIRAYPEPAYSGERPPLPDDDTEGKLWRAPDGKLYRSWAVPVRVEDGEIADRRVRPFETETVEEGEGGEGGVEVERRVPVAGFFLGAVERDDGTYGPPPELAQFAGASRKRSLRLYNLAESGPSVPSEEGVDAPVYLAVEHEWREVDEPYADRLGSAELRVHPDGL